MSNPNELIDLFKKLSTNDSIGNADFMNSIIDYLYEIFRVVIYPIE